MEHSYIIPPRRFSELISCLIWHLPLPYEYALSTDKMVEDLEKKDLLFVDNNIYNIIYDCIHYNNKGYDNMIHFINILRTSSEDKAMITNELFDINMYDMYILYDFINKYIDMIDTIPNG